MLVMVVFFIAFRWIHLSTPLIRLFLLVLILLLMPTLNFLPVWFALSLLRFRLPSRLPMMFILSMVAVEFRCGRRCFAIPDRLIVGHLQVGGDLKSLLLVQLAGIEPIVGKIDGQRGWVEIERRKLGIAVVGKMPTGAVKLEPADVRGVDRLVAALDPPVLDERIPHAAHERSARHP